MPTRRQHPENREFRQNAFASSAEYERGILGNLVAARCHKLTDPEEIAMLWWLQQISWRDGGLEKFASDFLARHSLQVEEFDAAELLGGVGGESRLREITASEFAERIRFALVDPSSPTLRRGMGIGVAVQSKAEIWEALCDERNREIEAARTRLVETEVTRCVSEALDFALETRSLILIEGREGFGKSEAARSWCEQHPGRAIYVRLESGLDDTTLFRSIARKIGTACSYARKAVEMRVRIQDSLQGGHVMLVLDEAHFLWPDSVRFDRTVPRRMDWVRTSLVDFGVPVALISTPQHFAKKCEGFNNAGWNANQVVRRVAKFVELPKKIADADKEAVARFYFPDVPADLIGRAVTASGLHASRLTMFSHLRKRVDFMAARQPRSTEADLLSAALDEFGAPKPAPAASPGKPVSEVLQPSRNRAAAHVPTTSPALAGRLSGSVQQLVPSSA